MVPPLTAPDSLPNKVVTAAAFLQWELPFVDKAQVHSDLTGVTSQGMMLSLVFSNMRLMKAD